MPNAPPPPRIISIRAQITRERGLPRPDAARLAEFERRLTAAVSARATEQEQLFTRLPDLAGWRGMFAPCTITDLTQVLGSGEVLLDFIMDEDALVGLAAWVDEGKVVSRCPDLDNRPARARRGGRAHAAAARP